MCLEDISNYLPLIEGGIINNILTIKESTFHLPHEQLNISYPFWHDVQHDSELHSSHLSGHVGEGDGVKMEEDEEEGGEGIMEGEGEGIGIGSIRKDIHT